MIDVNKASLTKILEFCEIYASNRGIKIIYEDEDENCWANIYTKEISINIKTFKKETIPFAFFHEMGHFKVFEKNIFRVARCVFGQNCFDKLSDSDKITYKNTVLKLEQWCDTFSEKETSKYFINAKIYKPYYQEYGKKYIKENYYFS